MAKHIVSCVACGKQFDANSGGKYDASSRRYTCPDCAGKQYDAAVDALTKKLKRRFILKIALGILFLLSGIVTSGDYSIGVRIATSAIGVALLARALIPYFKAKRQIGESEE